MNRSEIQRRAGLDDHALDYLGHIESFLPLMADLARADLFVDCMEQASSRMFVVAQAKLSFMSSAYRTSVIGCYAERADEPAVYHAVETCAPVRDIKAVTQEDSMVRQDVVPISDDSGRVIAALISERDISYDIRREQKYEALARRIGTSNGSRVSPEIAARREAHHRVKNHLQMIASLMNMQARKNDNPEVQQVIRENIARVLSIASVNDLLTYHESEQVSLHGFLEKMCQHLAFFNNSDVSVRIFDGDDIIVDPDQATDIAIIVNELISNACRHAFPSQTDGEVRVILKNGRRYSTITVQDNGTGFKTEQTDASGFGMSIVEMLVRDKLEGKLYVSSGVKGTSVTFDFCTKHRVVS